MFVWKSSGGPTSAESMASATSSQCSTCLAWFLAKSHKSRGLVCVLTACAMVIAKVAEAAMHTRFGWVSDASALTASATSPAGLNDPQTPSGATRINAPFAWVVVDAVWASLFSTSPPSISLCVIGPNAIEVVFPMSNGVARLG